MTKRKACILEVDAFEPREAHLGYIKSQKIKKVLKPVRNASLGIFTLIFLAVVGGFLYTWYMGGDNSAVAEEVIDTTSDLPTLNKPVIQATNVPVGVSVQSITSPITPGSNAMIAIKTNTYAKCKITVAYNKVLSKDSGLVDKTADDYGTVSWTWNVEPSVPLGKWPVTVTCANDTKYGLVIGDLVVAASTEEN
jgi:hypothetical protein